MLIIIFGTVTLCLQKLSKFIAKTNDQKVHFTLKSQGVGERSKPNGPPVFHVMGNVLSGEVACMRTGLFLIFVASWLNLCNNSNQTQFFIPLSLKAPNKNCSRQHFNFLLLSFEENKA